ncbi:MAG: pyruvate kinase, partial [Planctomycetes bacterium]|nr:pyruvate kinase [Planctomycetota bacterium]
MTITEAALAATLRAEVERLRTQALDLERRFQPALDALPAARRASAANLIHYLALRQNELRPLQANLTRLGLSSLGRSEAHALATLGAVSAVLTRIAGGQGESPEAFAAAMDAGTRILRANSEALLGPAPAGRDTRILVTSSTEAAYDPALIRAWMECGMNALRINCAHDDPDTWARMVENVEAARRAIGRPCRVLMDLAGPKLRTGDLESGPRVLRFKPLRDEIGRVVEPAHVWLTAAEAPASPPTAAQATLPVAAAWLARLAEGQNVLLRDLRGRLRRLTIQRVLPEGVLATCTRTAYVGPGTQLWHREDRADTCVLGEVPPLPREIVLSRGDTLVLTAAPVPGRPAESAGAGGGVQAATISCTLPQILAAVRAGEPIWLDDGKIGGTVIGATPAALTIRIDVVPPGGGKLGADKGINLPRTRHPISGLTEEDRANLPFVVRHADMVGQSFVNDPADVAQLQEELQRLGRPDLGIVLKIETQRAFAALPRILLQALNSPRAGVMIARGDLAVECGYERLAEVQEQILWISEAAHLPVIWATQVLESLAKRGIPSRAEITDAAMGDRAE